MWLFWKQPRCNFQIRALRLVPPVAVQIAKSELTSRYDLTHVTEVYTGGAPLPEDVYPQMRRHLASNVLFKQDTVPSFISPVDEKEHWQW